MMPISRATRRKSIPSCRVRLATDRSSALFPKDPVGEARYIAHVDARAHYPAPFTDGFQGRRNEGADGGENDCRIERLRRHFFGSAAMPRRRLRANVRGGEIARARKGEHRAPLPFRDLCQDMGRGAKQSL